MPARSQAPAQTAAGAGGRRPVAQQRGAEMVVPLGVPDLAEALVRRVAEGEAVITAHRERRDAAGQRPAMRGDVHQAPGPPAEGPGLRPVLRLEARRRVGRARGVEADAELGGQLFGRADLSALLVLAAGEQYRLLARQTLPLGEVDNGPKRKQ